MEPVGDYPAGQDKQQVGQQYGELGKAQAAGRLLQHRHHQPGVEYGVQAHGQITTADGRQKVAKMKLLCCHLFALPNNIFQPCQAGSGGNNNSQ